jgi:hypothetical protein
MRNAIWCPRFVTSILAVTCVVVDFVKWNFPSFSNGNIVMYVGTRVQTSEVLKRRAIQVPVLKCYSQRKGQLCVRSVTNKQSKRQVISYLVHLLCGQQLTDFLTIAKNCLSG